MSLPINEDLRKLQKAIGVTPDGKSAYTEKKLGETLQRCYDLHVKPNPSPPTQPTYMVDIYHGDLPLDLEKMKNDGCSAIIAKATQGLFFKDDQFNSIKQRCKAIGMPFGAYHFASGEDPVAQCEFFLSVATPQDCKVLALDWEENPQHGGSMSLSQARVFVEHFRTVTGKSPIIYGGGLIKDLMPSQGDAVLNSCPLWLAQYSATPTLPPGWDDLWAWQMTGDGIGPNEPKTFDGCDHPLDVSELYGQFTLS